MGLRDKLKQGVRTIFDRMSGEYSSAAPDPDTVERLEQPRSKGAVGEVKVTRAKLTRAKDLADKEAGE